MTVGVAALGIEAVAKLIGPQLERLAHIAPRIRRATERLPADAPIGRDFRALAADSIGDIRLGFADEARFACQEAGGLRGD
jgi:hypothetical protein